MTTLREAIREIVESYGAIKGLDLSLIMSDRHRELMEGTNKLNAYLSELETMVRNGEIMEIEYVLPEMPYRAKSIYLVKGTKIRMSLREVEIEKL